MMKPLGKNYGSIPHLSNSKLGAGDHFIGPGQERILTEKKRDRHDNILVFEKYDGSNVGVGKINNKIFALTRAGYEAKTSRYEQHHLFDKWVYSRESIFDEMLKEGERIAGEWVAQAHGMKYKIELDPIFFFDYFVGKERITYGLLELKANKYGLLLPRKLHEGGSVSVENLLPVLNKKDPFIKSEDLPEGMVYRAERKGKVDFLAKWVRKDFDNGKYLGDENNLTWNIWIDD